MWWTPVACFCCFNRKFYPAAGKAYWLSLDVLRFVFEFQIVHHIRSSGVLDECQSLVHEFETLATQAVCQFPMSEARTALVNMVQAAVRSWTSNTCPYCVTVTIKHVGGVLIVWLSPSNTCRWCPYLWLSPSNICRWCPYCVTVMNFIDYLYIVNHRQREIQFARACMVRHVPCSIPSICFNCPADTVVKWTKTLQNVFKKIITFFYIVAFLVCQEYPIMYANGRLACQQNTLQGMLGILVDVGCSSRAIRNLLIWFRTTSHAVDVRVVKTDISWTCISAIDSKLPLLLLLTHLGFIITESVRTLFVIVCGRMVTMHDVLTSDAF